MCYVVLSSYFDVAQTVSHLQLRIQRRRDRHQPGLRNIQLTWNNPDVLIVLNFRHLALINLPNVWRFFIILWKWWTIKKCLRLLLSSTVWTNHNTGVDQDCSWLATRHRRRLWISIQSLEDHLCSSGIRDPICTRNDLHHANYFNDCIGLLYSPKQTD